MGFTSYEIRWDEMGVRLTSKHSLLKCCGGIRLCGFEFVIQRSIEVLALPEKRALRIDMKGSMALPTKGGVEYVRSPNRRNFCVRLCAQIII